MCRELEGFFYLTWYINSYESNPVILNDCYLNPSTLLFLFCMGLYKYKI